MKPYDLDEILEALEYYHPKPLSVSKMEKPPFELRKQLLELRLIDPDYSSFPFGEDFKLTEFGEQLSGLHHAYWHETC